MRAVAAIPAVPLVAGAAVGLWLSDLPHEPQLIFLSACATVCAGAWRLTGRDLFAATVAAVFFTGGAMLAADAWARAQRPPLRIVFAPLARTQRADAERDGRRLPAEDEAFVVIEGVLHTDASAGDGGVSVAVDVDRVPGIEGVDGRERVTPGRETHRLTGGISVTVVGSLAAGAVDGWRAGRRVRMPVMLRRPTRYLDPGVADNEGALARKGVTLVGTVKSGALVEVLARGSPMEEALAAARSFARRAVRDAVGRWSAQSAAIVAAIIIGDRAGLDADLQRRLQDAGTYHVIAISGGNIAILAGLLLAMFRTAGWLGRTAMLSSIALLVTYGACVGNGASVDRATLMAVVYFGARAFDHRGPPLNALFVVAALLVAADPLAVADPAFILTFGATLAIVVAVPAVSAWMTRQAAASAHGRTPDDSRLRAFAVAIARVAVPMFAASLATEVLLLPVGALVFSRVTFAGLALNFVAIPLMTIAQVAGMALVPIAAVSRTAAAIVGLAAHAGALGLVRSTGLVSAAPIVAQRVAPPPWAVVVVYYAAVAVAWSVSRRRLPQRIAAGSAVAAAVWVLVDPLALIAAGGDGRLHLTFIDVGQGDATLVVFPRGATLLVDAGGLSAASSFDIGDRVVAPVLRDAGVHRLRYLALTHGDPDHIGGAGAILRDFQPAELWEGIPVPRFEALTRLRVATEAAHAKWANVYARDHVIVDDVDVVARHPRGADWERQKVRNDDSLVLELRWRDLSVVLTGDIGKAVESQIAAAIPPARLRIVKIPHHGSLTSSTDAFVRALHPTIAVASAGRNNHFGHPAPEVLERYVAAGARVFRTDRDGAVTVTSDGHWLDVSTFVDAQNHDGTKMDRNAKKKEGS